MSNLTRKDANLFLGILVISLIGNACADYALLWYGISKITGQMDGATHDSVLSYFYVGQSAGVIFLAPLFAVVFDRFSRFVSSVALDLIYAALLVGMGVFYSLDILTAPIIFFFSILTAALAILHKSSVGFAAVQKMSETTGVTDVVSKFITALNVPILVGSVLSGFVFKQFGFVGCIAIGVATFLPMPFVYYRVFKGEHKLTTSRKVSFLSDLKEGADALRKDVLLWGTAVSIMVLNIAAAVLPAIVGIAFTTRFPRRTDYASIAISLSILVGVLLTKYLGEKSKEWPTSCLVPISVLPALVMLAVCFFYPHPYLFALMFLLSCLGSNARSVSSSGLRIARVPKELMGRVNTVYTALLYLGQSLGGIIIVRAVENDIKSATLIIVVCFVAASVLSLLLLPRVRIKEFTEAKK